MNTEFILIRDHKPLRFLAPVMGRPRFWLTRCGHGCGFWDGDWSEPAATILTDAAHAFGNVDLYVGDDGKIYAMGYES